MKQLILNIATILIVCASASAQPDTLWTKTFGGFEIFDYGSSVQQTTDGGFIIAGCSFYMWPPDIYLIKTDAEGNQQWFRFFGGYADDYCNSVQQSSDGGYIIAGYTSSYGTGS
ncbi:MAG: hypothetical protein H8E87_05400, partial [FCB group bacterium]|nr:hypothetical protein [FCB group bacterium]